MAKDFGGNEGEKISSAENKNFPMPSNYLWCEKCVVLGVFFFYRQKRKSRNMFPFRQKKEQKTFVATEKIYIETCAEASARWALEFKRKKMNYKLLAE